MSDGQRIEELRRRIQKDPASIAFAQLAEEHRRAGQLEEAVRVCRAGLEQHPAYLSARITLGRALLEMSRYDEAVAEFEYVLKAAPDNLTAVRELADIEQRRRGDASETNSEQRRRGDASETNSEQRRRGDATSHQAAFAHSATASKPPTTDHQPPTTDHEPALDPVVAELEAWLSVLAEERAARTSRV